MSEPCLRQISVVFVAQGAPSLSPRVSAASRPRLPRNDRCRFRLSAALNGFDDGITGNFQAYPSWHQALGHPSNSAIGLLNASAYVREIRF